MIFSMNMVEKLKISQQTWLQVQKILFRGPEVKGGQLKKLIVFLIRTKSSKVILVSFSAIPIFFVN